MKASHRPARVSGFGLSGAEGDAIVDAVLAALAALDEELEAAGVSPADADLIRGRVLAQGTPMPSSAVSCSSPS